MVNYMLRRRVTGNIPNIIYNIFQTFNENKSHLTITRITRVMYILHSIVVYIHVGGTEIQQNFIGLASNLNHMDWMI